MDTINASRDPEKLINEIENLGIKTLHTTNGGFAQNDPVAIKRALAGLSFIRDQFDVAANPQEAFFVGINSDFSLGKAKQPAPALSEEQRVKRIMTPLIEKFETDSDIVVIDALYDEETNLELFQLLHKSGIEIRSHHKWGYGTGENTPIIVGGQYAKNVFGLRFNDATKPAFFDRTPTGNQTRVVKVIDLYSDQNPQGRAYLNPNHELI